MEALISAPEFIDTLLQAIVGIRAEVTKFVGKKKLSQNKDHRCIESAARGVAER